MNEHLRQLLRRESIPVLLLALAAVAAVAAGLAGRDALAAFVGALLVVIYCVVELLCAWIGGTGSFRRAMVVGAVGTVVRLVLAVGGLTIVALVDRPGLLDAIVAFVVVYTVYLGVRLWRHPLLAAERASVASPARRHRSPR
jgi:hypothetical protein